MADPKGIDIRTVVGAATQFPNDIARERFDRLVGIDDHASAVARDLHQIFHPHLASRWAETHYQTVPGVVGLLGDLVPLIIFEGDVGTGKSALAETVADVVARQHDYDIKLFKMSTQVRGHGYVGQMGTLLAMAFKHVAAQWERSSAPVLFVLDEADSLLTSRAAADHHHEDKSGVNTILQQLDQVARSPAQVAVIAITNRIGVLDPAVRRRATAVYRFVRPDASQRLALFRSLLGDAGFSEPDLEALAEASGPRSSGNESVPFSYSDLTLRLLIPAVRDAVHRDEPLTLEQLRLALASLEPSPQIEEG